MKKLGIIALALVLLLVVAGVVVYVRLDHIVKSVVETQATDSLNLTTTLDSAHLALFGGEVTLNDLQVASPQGFSAPHMVGFDKLHVGVKYGQLGKDPVRVATIQIDKPRLVIEQSGGKFNIQAVMDQQPKTAPPSTPPSGGERPKDQPIRVIIDQLDVTNAEVVVKAGLPGLDKEMTVPIPSLSLKNIGNADGAQNGAAIKEVVVQVVTALAGKASDAGALPAMLRDALKQNVGEIAGRLNKQFQDQMGQITGQLTGQVNQVTNQFTKQLPGDVTGKLPGDVGKQINAATQGVGKDVTKGIEQGLGGLLGGEKKDKKKDAK